MEEVLEEEGVDNSEDEQTEPQTEEEEDDVSEIIQKLTPILGSAKERGFTVNELEIEREKEEE
ncbi:MAG TPA: hypothetical protein VHF08_03435 [Nitrososphaeraceae archaeon]|nr:hypothetical protein [Nitrososphaeraceae archaeon]